MNQSRPQRIAAYQFSQLLCFVSWRLFQGPHLKKPHWDPQLGRLPGRLGAGKPAADND
jgi:hypothetical protein